MTKRIFGFALLMCALSLAGCNDEPDIKQAYDFSLSSWYLQKSATVGEEIEIRFYLEREGNFSDASYRFGYVQLDGDGRVYNTERTLYASREEYELSKVPGLDTSNPYKWVYTLYYRHNSDRKSELRFFVVDNFGHKKEYDVEFGNDSSNKD